MEFLKLQKKYWHRHFWVGGYFAVIVGDLTSEMVEEYIEHHFEGKEGSDAFLPEELLSQYDLVWKNSHFFQTQSYFQLNI